MQKILVTGASGYIGAKIFQDLKNTEKYEVTGTYHKNKLFKELVKLDLTQEDKVKKFIKKEKPDYVVHVAAHASSGWCEKHPKEAKALNLDATKYLVDAAKDIDTKFIYISTFAAYEAKNEYGASKRESEDLVKTLDNYFILRLSAVFGLSPNIENDRPFNRILKDILEKTKKPAYDTSWEFEMTYLRHVSEIVQRVIKSKDLKNLTLPVISSGSTNRYKIAKTILAAFKINDVEQVDDQVSIPMQKVDFKVYRKFKLPEYRYDVAMRNIIRETKAFVSDKK